VARKTEMGGRGRGEGGWKKREREGRKKSFIWRGGARGQIGGRGPQEPLGQIHESEPPLAYYQRDGERRSRILMRGARRGNSANV
jgi:hypothetical protein